MVAVCWTASGVVLLPKWMSWSGWSVVSGGLIGPGLQEVEINPLVPDGTEWVAVDWLAR